MWAQSQLFYFPINGFGGGRLNFLLKGRFLRTEITLLSLWLSTEFVSVAFSGLFPKAVWDMLSYSSNLSYMKSYTYIKIKQSLMSFEKKFLLTSLSHDEAELANECDDWFLSSNTG